MEYLFRAPTYQPFAYERVLAVHEIAALAGRQAEWIGEKVVVSVARPLPTEVLRRPAFSSCVESPRGAIPTQIHLLEQSALPLRNGNGNGGVKASFRKESTYLTHGLHRYKGKFYPQLCRALINIAGIDRGDLVLDPFMGSGTTLVECAISGVEAVGLDLNPLAHRIASAKVQLLRTPAKRLHSGLRRFEASLARQCRRLGLCWSGLGSPEPEGDRSFPAATLARECGLPEATGEIQRWFPAAVQQKLTAVLRTLQDVEDPAFRQLAQVCLSDQIRLVSQQDPRDLRIRRRAEEIEDAPLLTLLCQKLVKELEKLKAGLEVLGGTITAEVSAELRDARVLEAGSHPVFSRRCADAVVTSPPYANALPYIDTDRLSLLILGLLSTRQRNCLQKQIIGNREIHEGERRALAAEMQDRAGLATFPAATARQIRKVLKENERHPVGFRRRNVPVLLYQYFRDMRTVMRNLFDVVRPGGKAFIVLGDSVTRLGSGEELAIQTTSHVAALAEQVGWARLDRIPITVTVEDLAHVRNSITENAILVFEKPSATHRRSTGRSRGGRRRP